MIVVVIAAVVVFAVVVSFQRKRKTEKEMKDNIWRRKTDQQTDQPNKVQSAFSKVGK